jgi:hypothetical protein
MSHFAHACCNARPDPDYTNLVRRRRKVCSLIAGRLQVCGIVNPLRLMLVCHSQLRDDLLHASASTAPLTSNLAPKLTGPSLVLDQIGSSAHTLSSLKVTQN